jgi:hypothetical protein
LGFVGLILGWRYARLVSRTLKSELGNTRRKRSRVNLAVFQNLRDGCFN